jgi:hypothetical protein
MITMLRFSTTLVILNALQCILIVTSAEAACQPKMASKKDIQICGLMPNRIRIAATVKCAEAKPILCDGTCSAGGGACGLGYDANFKQICECGH